MRQPLFFLKRHALPLVMAFFLFFAAPFFSSSGFCDENEGLQDLLINAESETNIERLLELIEDLKKKQNSPQ